LELHHNATPNTLNTVAYLWAIAKPDSHATLYAALAQRTLGKDLHQVTQTVHSASGVTHAIYRYAAQLPLRASADTLYVNWCELTLTDAVGTQLYHNAFMTQAPLTAKTIAPIIQAGRTRWKVENENNNTLKTQGYHLEHNFGHGTQHLAALLATFNLLAFLLHTLLDLLDAQYHQLRRTLVSRKTFFDDLRALTRYLCFPSWGAPPRLHASRPPRPPASQLLLGTQNENCWRVAGKMRLLANGHLWPRTADFHIPSDYVVDRWNVSNTGRGYRIIGVKKQRAERANLGGACVSCPFCADCFRLSSWPFPMLLLNVCFHPHHWSTQWFVGHYPVATGGPSTTMSHGSVNFCGKTCRFSHG
jgi:hypothetical protein